MNIESANQTSVRATSHAPSAKSSKFYPYSDWSAPRGLVLQVLDGDGELKSMMKPDA